VRWPIIEPPNGFVPEAQRLGVSARFHTSLFESKIKGGKQLAVLRDAIDAAAA